MNKSVDKLKTFIHKFMRDYLVDVEVLLFVTQSIHFC